MIAMNPPSSKTRTRRAALRAAALAAAPLCVAAAAAAALAGRQDAPTPPTTPERARARVVCLGDSITKAGYPEELSKLLGGAAVVNAGIGGNPSGAGLRRLERQALAYRPEAVVVLFGTNDMRADAPHVFAAPDAYARNLRAIVAACRKAGAKPVLCTVPPIDEAAYFTRHARAPFDARGGLAKMVRDYRDVAANVARELNVPLVDLNADLAAAPGWRSPDGVHPTAEGNRQIARRVARVVAPLLGLPVPAGDDAAAAPRGE